MNKFSINIFDIKKKQYNRNLRRLKIYDNILEKCFHKINSTVDNEYNHCFFKIPEYILGEPVYNLTKCVIYLLQKLRENGFKCKYCHPFMIYISWNYNDNVLLINNDYVSNNKDDIVINNKENNINEKDEYRNIEKSSDLDYLLFRKN